MDELDKENKLAAAKQKVMSKISSTSKDQNVSFCQKMKFTTWSLQTPTCQQGLF